MKSLKQLILFAFLCFFFVSSYGQHTFKAILKDVESKAALIDATVHVKGTSLGGKTNEFGLVEIKNIPCIILFSLINPLSAIPVFISVTSMVMLLEI